MNKLISILLLLLLGQQTLACSLGEYEDPTTAECLPCSDNSYNSQPNATECQPCQECTECEAVEGNCTACSPGL